MRNYWSCTKFADWIRGTNKPDAETGKGWHDWNKTAKQQHPIRYWLAEEGLDALQNVLYSPADAIYNVKYYINNRWISKSHALTAHPTHIKPGKWCDLGNRFLPCLFDELVNFVEVECAWHNVAWDKDARKKYRPPFYARGWFRWRTWRSAESGLDYLNWAADLKIDETWAVDSSDENYGKPTHQAIAAREILELYRWYTQVYETRPDPHEASGWSDLCARRRESGKDFFDFEDRTPEEAEESQRILALLDKIEQEQKTEDTEMMIRLIKIRDSLWT